jgi:hypothetical protein
MFQFMPATAKRYGLDNPEDPIAAAQAASQYLGDLRRRYKGDARLMLAAYNAGEGNVDKYGGIPPFPETQNYVRNIIPKILAEQAGSDDAEPERPIDRHKQTASRYSKIPENGSLHKPQASPDAGMASPPDPGRYQNRYSVLPDEPTPTDREKEFDIPSDFDESPSTGESIRAGAQAGFAQAERVGANVMGLGKQRLQDLSTPMPKTLGGVPGYLSKLSPMMGGAGIQPSEPFTPEYDPATVEGQLRREAETRQAAAQEAYTRSGIGGKTIQGLSEGIVEAPLIASLASMGGPAGVSVLSALDAADQGTAAMEKNAAIGAGMGQFGQAIASRGRLMQGAAMGGMNALATGMQGGTPTDVIASAISGGAAGVALGGGGRSEKPPTARAEPPSEGAATPRPEPQNIGARLARAQPPAEKTPDGPMTGKAPIEEKAAPSANRYAKLPEEGGADNRYADVPDDGIVQMHMGIPPGEAIKGAVEAAKKGYRALAQTEWGKRIIDPIETGINAVQLSIAPMAAKSDVAERAVSQDYIAALRADRFQTDNVLKILTDELSPTELEHSWQVLSDANVISRDPQADPNSAIAHLQNNLSPKELEAVNHLKARNDRIADEAVKLGILKNRFDVYDPRVIVDTVGGDRIKSASKGIGRQAISDEAMGFKTTTPQAKHRKYMTAEETEAAAKAKLGDNVGILRDIRVLAMTTQSLAEAVAGKRLINQIKEIGKARPEPTVVAGEKPSDNYFTINHPSFTEYKPMMTTTTEGKVVPVADSEGKTVMQKVPLYIDKAFEGPLKAVLTPRKPAGDLQPIYHGLMEIKKRATMMLMYWPTIHALVEVGRSLPLLKSRILSPRFWIEANRAKHTPEIMDKLIRTGNLDPIGKRGYIRDITDLSSGSVLDHDRGWVSSGVGKMVGKLTSPESGEATSQIIDNAGDFWHNTLLWNRVGDLQVGIAQYVMEDLAKNPSMDESTRLKIAGHFANRFAGALPSEAMSAGARVMANLALFSRTFTLGNLGLIKDAIVGLPKGVQAQIERYSGAAMKEAAQSSAKQKAFHAIALDLAIYYGVNTLAQHAFDMLSRDQSLSDIEKGYVQRWKEFQAKTKDSWRNLFFAAEQLTPMYGNEPGKQDRVYMGMSEKGRGQYLRIPTGKVPEEMIAWAMHPLDTLHRKESTILRPLQQIWEDSTGFGRKVFDDNKTMSENLGKAFELFASSQIPLTAMESAQSIYKGHGRSIDYWKVVGGLAGVSVSQGHPAGPRGGVLAKQEKDFEQRKLAIFPDANRLIQNGEVDKAKALLAGTGMTPREVQRYLLNQTKGAKISVQQMRKFYRHTPKEDQQELLNVNQ